MALEGVRLRCSGAFSPWRDLVSCRSLGQGPEALGSGSVTGREPEAPVNVPVATRFGHLSAFASRCWFGSRSRAELGSVAAWLFGAPVAAGSAAAVSQTSNYVFKPTAVPPLRFNQALPLNTALELVWSSTAARLELWVWLRASMRVVGGRAAFALSGRVACAAVVVRRPAALVAALRLAGGCRWSCCPATAWASSGRIASRGGGDTERCGKIGRAPACGRSGQGFVWPRLQARRVVSGWRVAEAAALGVRAVVSSAHGGRLFGVSGSLSP
jgi:hypothetical protein